MIKHSTDLLCVLCCRRRPEIGQACSICRDKLDEHLADIPRRHAQLPDMLMPTVGGIDGEGGSRGKRAAPPAPLRIDVLNLLGPSNPSLNASSAVREGALPTLEVLAIKEHEIRRARELAPPDPLATYAPWFGRQLAWVRSNAVTRPLAAAYLRWLIAALFRVPELRGQTVRECVAFLRLQLDWVCAQDMVEGFALEVRDAHNRLKDVFGEHRPKPIGTCPTGVTVDGRQPEDGEEAVRVCGTKLWASTNHNRVRCDGCGRKWEREDWDWMLQTLGSVAS